MTAQRVPDEVRAMFEVASAGSLATDAMDRIVTEGLTRFLGAEAHDVMDLAKLTARFTDARVPDAPQSVEIYLRYLFEEIVPHSVRTHSRRFIGHMTSALPNFVDPLGRIMTALNQNVVKLETSNAFTFYERQALAMMHRLVFDQESSFYDTHVQRPESTLGMIVSGGTLANLAALWCARNRCLGAREGFAGVETEGMSEALRVHGYRRAVIIGSSLMHYSLEKAADFLGLGKRGLVKVPATVDGTVNVRLLEQVLARSRAEGDLVLALVGIAGTTETGAVDPLTELADLAATYRCHFHVDAAWGGPVLFSPRYSSRLSGVARADSVTIDGHKQLYLPMGLGMVVLRDPETARSIETNASYIVRQGSLDLGRRALEGSRPAMAIFLHGALHIIGQRGYAALVENGIENAAFLADAIAARQELELLAQPRLNIVVYRYLPPSMRTRARAGNLDEAENRALNELNRQLQEVQRDRGWSFISRTTLSNTRYAPTLPIVSLRAVLANPLTTREDISAVLDEQIELGDRLSAQGGTVDLHR